MYLSVNINPDNIYSIGQYKFWQNLFNFPIYILIKFIQLANTNSDNISSTSQYKFW